MKVIEKLILRPALAPIQQRRLFGLLTLLAWTGYLYLWAPLATLALWLAGLRSSYLQLYLQRNEVNVALLLQLVAIALVCAALLLGWAEYNRLRFQGKDRRGRQPDASLEVLADTLGMAVEHAERLRQARSVVIRMDAEARPLEVTAHQPPPLPALLQAARPALAVEQ